MTRSSFDSRWRDPEQPERSGRDRFHVAINMDGNGRWALLRGRPREAGHVAGAAVRPQPRSSGRVIRNHPLTLYAFLDNGGVHKAKGEPVFPREVPGRRVRQLTAAECLSMGVGMDSASLDRIAARRGEDERRNALHLRVATIFGREALWNGGSVATEYLDARRIRAITVRSIHAPRAYARRDLLIRTRGERDE